MNENYFAQDAAAAEHAGLARRVEFLKSLRVSRARGRA